MIYDSKIARLKFNLGTLVDIKDKTGKDPLTSIGETRDVPEMIEYVKAIFDAGCRTSGAEPDGDFYDLSFNDLSEIMLAFTKAYSVPGEVNGDTQPGQTATTY